MDNFWLNISKNIPIIRNNKIVKLVLLVIMIELLFSPFPGFADNSANRKPIRQQIVEIKEFLTVSGVEAKREENIVVIKTEEREVAWSKRYAMTAYNSEVGQCDDSPCITANGFNVCEHGIEDTVAANFLPFGTEIRIPELFGDKILIVRDRMNARYTDRVDVWLLSHDNAIDFGVKYPMIEILSPKK